jgi:hypothetical protein
MNTITWVAVLFSVEIAGVFALEFLGKRRVRRVKPVRFAIEDEDGRTRIFYLSPELGNLNVSSAATPVIK